MGAQRNAVITGAARGIGESTARLLALSHGMRVVILDIQELGAKVAEAIRAEGGVADFHQCDVSSHDAVRRVAGLIETPIHVLVNNAGWTSNERFIEQDPALWAKIISINYEAVLYTTREFVPSMAAGATIVNVSSDAARLGAPKEAVYAGAKAAVIAFSKAMALELASRGIRVNVVCPSTTLTALPQAVLTKEQIQRRIRANPMGRLGEPADIAEAIAAFAVGLEYVTGQVLSVNGGSSRVD